MQISNWDTLKTAHELAKRGTVSSTAEALGIHRATVIRHIDSLEQVLNCKLFYRHGRGYTMTEAGQELLHATNKMDAAVMQLHARIRGQDKLAGDFVITSLEFIAPLLMPVLQHFGQQHPNLCIRYLTSQDLFKLEHGQAHIAIRTGIQPEHPDYVVRPFASLQMGLYAHSSYVTKFGLPTCEDDLSMHQFVSTHDDAPKPAAYQWLHQHVPTNNIIFRSNNITVLSSAIKSGIGIGAMLVHEARKDLSLIPVQFSDRTITTQVRGEYSIEDKFKNKTNQTLPTPIWKIHNWLLTHGDLHRSDKVQHFLSVLNKNSLSIEYSA